MGEAIDGLEEEEILEALEGGNPEEYVELKNKKGKKIKVRIERIDPATTVDNGDIEI
ncbi:MAG: hypothetical protein NTX24_01490 [Candidatus Pacearchaeota archaeon]|nr:hypothetical protein [Candidatus Pacearchaeota archaeon]